MKSIKHIRQQAWNKYLVMCRAVFMLDGKFDHKWVKRKGFWKLLWFSIVAKFGVITTNKYEIDCCYFSVGTPTPLDEYWNNGYKVSLAGKILGECVLFYERQ